MRRKPLSQMNGPCERHATAEHLRRDAALGSMAILCDFTTPLCSTRGRVPDFLESDRRELVNARRPIASTNHEIFLPKWCCVAKRILVSRTASIRVSDYNKSLQA
jgi:hypothetical protein